MSRSKQQQLEDINIQIEIKAKELHCKFTKHVKIALDQVKEGILPKEATENDIYQSLVIGELATIHCYLDSLDKTLREIGVVN